MSYLKNRYDQFAKVESERASAPSRPKVAVLGFEEVRRHWGRFAFDLTRKAAEQFITVAQGAGRQRALLAIEEGIKSGVLRGDIPGSAAPERVQFAHHRLQEFLAGWHLATDPEAAARQGVEWDTVLDEPRWQETILNLAAASGTSAAVSVLAESICRPSLVALKARNERTLADRVQLASRIVQEVGGRQTPAGSVLYEPAARAIAYLLESGQPSTQVKMLVCCKQLGDIDYYTVAQEALSSQVRWVRNQALIVAAEVDILRRQGLSQGFYDQLTNDVTSGRVIRRLGAYRSAWAATANVPLSRHIYSALVSLAVGVAAPVMIVLGVYFGCLALYPGSTFQPPPVAGAVSAASTNSGGDDFSGEAGLGAQTQAMRPAADEVWSGANAPSGSAPFEPLALFLTFGTFLPPLVIAAVMLGGIFLFSIRRDTEVELTILLSGIVVGFMFDQLARAGNFMLAVGELEMLSFAVVLALPIAVLCHAVATTAYWFCVQVIGGTTASWRSLLRQGAQYTLAGGAVLGFMSFLTRHKLEFACAIAALTASVVGIATEDIARYASAGVFVVAVGTWLFARRDLVAGWIGAVGVLGAAKQIGWMILMIVVLFGALGALGYGNAVLMEKAPETSRRVGAGPPWS